MPMTVSPEPPRLPKHGTVARHVAGCDCTTCKRADCSNARYRPQRRGRRGLVLNAVEGYRRAGWSPFPLPVAKKFPPPRGVTGSSARPITDADYEAWEGSWANVGVVMPDGVVGLDLDLYKPGNALSERLPSTVRSTSRDDGSGIYLFRVPPGTKLKGTIDGLGEVVQRHHRYAVVWPSLHPENRTYRWLDDDDNEVEIPAVEDLPWLPESWLRRLSERPARRRGTSRSKGYGGDLEDWLERLPGGRMHLEVRAVLRRSLKELRRCQVTRSSRYDAMVRTLGRLVHLGAERKRGVADAIGEYLGEYLGALDGEPGRDPAGEVVRALTGAVAKFGGGR